MASVRYRKRGDSNLWTYEIRNEGKTVAHNSGFKTKKLAESEAERLLIKKCGANDGANALKTSKKALVIKAFTVEV